MAWIGYFIIGFVVSLSAFVVTANYLKTKRNIGRMNQMLDAAMEGNFSEEMYDESLLSALELRFAQYLAAVHREECDLQKERDQIRTLIADISHQTKTPIANLLLYTQLLAEQELPPESRARVMALEGQVEKLQSLIEVLVKTSRLETGIITLQPVSGPLEEVITAAVSQLSPKAEAKGISLKVESCEGEALFDPKWTEEAVFNLLDNGVKYTPAGGCVAVSTVMYQSFVCIRVADTGAGIPEEERPKIFQRFYRGTDHRTQEGVGIGLYLVRCIAEGQGGYVKVDNGSRGGAVFSLYLPRS